MKKITFLLIAFIFTYSNQIQGQVFTENFDSGSVLTDLGWTVIDNDGQTPNAAVAFIDSGWNSIDRDGDNGSFGGPAGNFAAMSTSWYETAGTSDDWLISPSIDIPVGEYSLYWSSKAQDVDFPDGFELRISTTAGTTIADFTTVLFSTAAENPDWTSHAVDLSAYSGQTVTFAWVNNSTDMFVLLIDDISVTSTIPVPDCASNPTPADAATNVPIGAITLSWNAPTTGGTVDSYDLYVGDTADTVTFLVGNYVTTDTGTDLTINNYGVTVYWKIVPKNAGGDATGCPVWSFTTELPPGYCLNAPDGQYPAATFVPATCDGLTDNVIRTNCWAGEYSVVTVTAGQSYTFKSGSTDFITISDIDGTNALVYGTTPLSWVSTIDGDVRFYSHIDDQCGTEQVNRTRSVLCGTPSADSPDYVNLQFPPTISVTQGNNGTVYGQVYEPGLTDTTTGQAPGINAWVGISPAGDNSNPNTWTTWVPATFNVESGNNDEYQAAIGSTLAPGTYYYATRFNLNGGAYVYGGLNNGFWNAATNPSGVLTVNVAPAPANDECTGAIVLTPGGDFAAGAVSGTVLSATDDAVVTPSCAFNNVQNSDVWYSVVVPASGNITIETQASTTNSLTDTTMAVYTGTCGTLTELDCNDDIDGTIGNFMSSISLTGQTPGTTLYVGLWKWGTTAPSAAVNGFIISAYDASLANENFDNNTFTVYPNPVKNVLNVSYSEDITSVEVSNLLGQKMVVTKIGATNGQVDMSNLSAGTYMVKITSNNLVKTMKVIKE